MEHKKWVAISQLKRSISDIRKNLVLFPFPVLSDLLFLIVYGFIGGFIRDIMMGKLYEAGSILAKDSNTPNLFLSSPDILNLVTSNPMTDSLLKQFFLWAFILAVVSFMIYCLFQALSWKLCLKIAGKDVSYVAYLKRFAGVNILFFSLFLVYSIISALDNFRNSLGALDYINEPASKVSIFLNIFLVILLAIAFTSYCLADRKSAVKNTFKLLFKRPVQIIFVYLFIAVALLITDLILNKAFLLGTGAMLIAGIFIALPVISWLRVYLKCAVDTLSEERMQR